MEHVQGCTFCDAALTGVPAARNGAGPARVVLPAGALNAAGLSCGELVLLAVVQVPDDSGAAATPDAPRGRQGASSAATPPRTPPSGSRGSARPQLSVGADASPLVFARSRNESSDEGVTRAAEAGSQPPGARLLAAAVWPSQQLAAGTASASAAVLEAACWPPAGAVLRVYPLAAPGAQQRVRARVTEAASLTLTVCEPVAAEPATALPDAAAGSPLTPQSSHAGAAKASGPAASPAYKAGAAKSLGNLRCAGLSACCVAYRLLSLAFPRAATCSG